MDESRPDNSSHHADEAGLDSEDDASCHTGTRAKASIDAPSAMPVTMKIAPGSAGRIVPARPMRISAATASQSRMVMMRSRERGEHTKRPRQPDAAARRRMTFGCLALTRRNRAA
ncbi:MAG: hypothetical protein U1F58_08180 [Burkholderiales bacterium]